MELEQYQLPPEVASDESSGARRRTKPLNKSCETCRRLKIRCLPDRTSSPPGCQRCVKLNEACVLTAPRKRIRRRNSTNVRVASLETEVRALRSLMNDQDSSAGLSVTAAQTTGDSAIDDINTTFTTSDMVSTSGSQASRDLHQDVIDRGMLSLNTATRLYDDYTQYLAPHYPLVVFDPAYSAERLRRERPLLFLAVLAASAVKSNPTLYGQLSAAVMQAYAENLVLDGEKSLEVVQAIIVTAVWFYPPEKFAQLKFYEYVHMATTMAIDIGLADKPTSRSVETSTQFSSVSDSSSSASTSATIHDAERLRTLLACYCNCCGTSLSMRRPNSFPFSDWLAECAQSLLSNLNCAPSDSRLVAWVRLLAIAEEFTCIFSAGNINDSARLACTHTASLYKAFGNRLTRWQNAIARCDWNADLSIAYNYVRILLCEPTLHQEHPSDCFRPPFPMSRRRPANEDCNVLLPSIELLHQCVSSIHGVFESFLAEDVHYIRVMPVHVIHRVCYATVVLTRLQVSCEDTKSTIARLVDSMDLKLDYYNSLVMSKLAEASNLSYRIPTTFLESLMRLRQWLLFQRARGYNWDEDDEEPFTLFASNPKHPVLKFNGSDLGDDGISRHLCNNPLIQTQLSFERSESATTASQTLPQTSNINVTPLSEPYDDMVFGDIDSVRLEEYTKPYTSADIDALIANWNGEIGDFDHFDMFSQIDGSSDVMWPTT